VVSAELPILVIDDDESIREFVRVALAEEGYRVLVAANGQEALKVLQADRPGLILLDVWMPEMDGAGFLAAYCSLPEPRAPVVIFAAAADATANDWPADVAGFLPKPVDLTELMEAVALHSAPV
jgi:two-component system chemotaxis response regulator CheY